MENAAVRSEVVRPMELGVPQEPGLELRLRIRDPEVLAELNQRKSGTERERFAEAALRIGVLALRSAGGQVDGATIREAGQELMSQVRELLGTRATELTTQMTSTLRQFFDPKSGLVPQKIESLVKEGGELERALKAQVGPSDSVLARSLAAALGEGSPIFKLLSPTDSQGLKVQLSKALEEALASQRQHLLQQFSLDSKDSALSRLVSEIQRKQAELSEDLKGQVEGVVKEFSLDDEGSALSRLVTRVERAQREITEQFSADNERSALNRLTGLLKDTSEQIGQHLTLDDEGSALSRLKKELFSTLEEHVKRTSDFHSELRETLAVFKTRKEEADKSSLHGLAFEEKLGAVLATKAARLGDVFEATGTKVGVIKNCKTGDFVTTMGADSRAPGAGIVWEAKEDKGYSLKEALAEIDQARKNRQAQIGIFVFSKKSSPTDSAFQRQGDDLVVVWDPEEPGSELLLDAAYQCARALTLRQSEVNASSAEALQGLELATRAIEKQLCFLEDVQKNAETARSSGEKISRRAEMMRAELEKQVRELDEALGALKQGGET